MVGFDQQRSAVSFQAAPELLGLKTPVASRTVFSQHTGSHMPQWLKKQPVNKEKTITLTSPNGSDRKLKKQRYHEDARGVNLLLSNLATKAAAVESPVVVAFVFGSSVDHRR